MSTKNLIGANRALSTCRGWTDDKRECVTKFDLEFIGSSGRVFVRNPRDGKFYKLEGYRSGDSRIEIDIFSCIKNTHLAKNFAEIRYVAKGILECEYVDGIPISDCPSPVKEEIREEISFLKSKLLRLYGIRLTDLGGDNIRVMRDNSWKIVDYGCAYLSLRGVMIAKFKRSLNYIRLNLF